MNRPKNGSFVNYHYTIPQVGTFKGWGKVVGEGRFEGMGRVIHILPFNQKDSIPICLKPGEIHASRSS